MKTKPTPGVIYSFNQKGYESNAPTPQPPRSPFIPLSLFWQPGFKPFPEQWKLSAGYMQSRRRGAAKGLPSIKEL